MMTSVCPECMLHAPRPPLVVNHQLRLDVARLGVALVLAELGLGVQELLAAKRDLDLPRRLRKLDNFDFLLLDDLGYLPQGAEESVVLFTLIAERYEHSSLGITSNLVFSEWERIFANPMATTAATSSGDAGRGWPWPRSFAQASNRRQAWL